MRRAFIIILLLLNSLRAAAQKNYAYTDGAISLAYYDPGFSATYNYNLIKYIGIGIGTQGYIFHPAKTNPHQFTPALFADIRFLIRPEKISQYFVLLDFGINFYKHHGDSLVASDYIYTVPNDNGVYVGLGIGYFLRLTYRGWGVYTSAKLINNIYKRYDYNIAAKEQSSINAAGGTIVLSLGFRFGDDNKDFKIRP